MTESANLPLTFGGLDENDSDQASARVLIWPVGYERTVSYGGGTKDGPAAIIDASRHMELYDEELGGETARIGIHTLPAMATEHAPADMMAALYEQATTLLDSNKFLCTLGGEHSISGPVIRAHKDKYPGLSVLQIDAHADLRESYDGTPHSHASVMRRVTEFCPAVQVGIRSLSADEARAIPSLPVTVFFAKDIAGRTDWMERAIDSLSDTVYLTFDVDGLDPSIMPATGTPEPGGLLWYDVLEFLRLLAARKKVVGMDVVELSLVADSHAPSFLTAKLIYKALGYFFREHVPGL